MHPLQNQRTVLVVGGFPHDTERDVICEKLREMFGQELGVKDWWTPEKVGSVGKVNFHTNDHAWTFPQEVQGQDVFPRIKAAVAHLGPPEGRSPALQEGLSGDQSPAHSSGGERILDEWGRDGHRRRTAPCVVQENANGGASGHSLSTHEQHIIRVGIHC